MPSEADQIEIIGLMAAHEAAVADLYRAYAARFPPRQELFLGLAAEEVEHARLITDLAGRVKAGAVHIAAGRFSAAAMLGSLDYVRERTAEAGKGEVSLSEALAACHDLEHAFIERRFFEIIEGDALEVKELLRLLAEETGAHRARLDEATRRAEEDSDVGAPDAPP